MACRGDLGNHFIKCLDLVDNAREHLLNALGRGFNFCETLADLAAGNAAEFAAFDSDLDLVRSVPCRLGAALGKSANLVSDDCETSPGFTGTRRLDGGIECEQICLKCDLVNGLDDLGDFLA